MTQNESQRQTILIADDTEFFRVVISDILKSEGYNVMLAKDGQETLDLLLEHGKDLTLLIMDIIMPQLTGKEVLETLKDRGISPTFKILVMTGFKQDPEQIGELRALGIDGFISKKEPPRFFVDRIKQMLNKS